MHYDATGTPTSQEVASGGRQPDKKLLLGPGGVVIAQCTLSEDGKRLNTRANVDTNGTVVAVLTDTSGNKIADQRVVYSGGAVSRIEVDTNGNRKPNAAIYYDASGQPTHQDEDADHDGIADHRFQGQEPVALPEGTRIPGERFGPLGCGGFHRFWWKR